MPPAAMSSTVEKTTSFVNRCNQFMLLLRPGL
jgi:hypothetical protein